MNNKQEKVKSKKENEKILNDMFYWTINQDLFIDISADNKINGNKIKDCIHKLVDWVLDKTNYDLESSKTFVSFIIKEYQNSLFDLLQKSFSKNLNAMWWQYETKQKISEKSKNFETPNVEAKMESGQNTSSFSNKKHTSKVQSLNEEWNEVNETNIDIIQSGDMLGDAKIAKAQAITSGAIEIGQSTSNILSSSMSVLSAPQLITDLTNMMVSETTSYVASAIKDITFGCATYVAKFPSRVTSLTSQYYKEHLSYYNITLDDIMMSEESKAQIQLEKSKSLEKKKILDEQTQNVQENTVKINNTVSNITNGMNSIAEHISEGPSWVETQCTKLLFNGLSYVGKIRDNTLDTVYNNLENKADSIARDNASKKFKDFDKKKKDKLKKEYEKIQINAMKAKLKASQVVAVAKSKIIAKLGL